MSDALPFPPHNINPKFKGYSWILKFCRAIYGDGYGGLPRRYFFNHQGRYEEIEQYALGKQSITKYKRFARPDEPNDNSNSVRDYTVVPIIPKFINIAVAKILQRQFEPTAYAIDPLSKTEEDEWYKQQLIKINAKQAILEAGGNPADYPMLQQGSEDPEDIEQLNIVAQFGFKNVFAMDAELVVADAFAANNMDRERTSTVKRLVNHGIGGYRSTLTNSGKSKIRAINPSRMFVSYCEQPDFSDASYIAEATFVNVSELIPYFTPNQIAVICNKIKGQWDNPSEFNVNREAYYDKFKCLVLDAQFKSYNTKIFKSEYDESGNAVFDETDYDDIKKVKPYKEGEEEEQEYVAIDPEVMYEAKWIVGTEFLYQYGLKKNQLIKEDNFGQVEFDYAIEAWNFHNMMYSGITEGLIPLADEYEETQLKIQNIKNKLIPYAITVDIRALENVKFGKGGSNMKPEELIDLMFKSYILVYSGEDLITGNGTPGKPINIEVTGMAQELVYLSQELQRIKDNIRDASGLNEATDGSAPNARMLTTGLNLANASTNNALYLISEADKRLQIKLANIIVMQAQMGVKLGEVKGMVKGLGKDTLQTFQVADGFSMRAFSMYFEDAPSQEQRQELYNIMAEYFKLGLLTPADRILIESCKNIKQAGILLDYRIKKAKEEQQANKQADIKANNDGAAQAAVVAETEKRKTYEITKQGDLEKINATKQWDWAIKKLQVDGTSNDTQVVAQANIIKQHIIENSKKSVDASMQAAM